MARARLGVLRVAPVIAALMRRNLNSRDEKSLNQWIDEIAAALKRIKAALDKHKTS